MKKSILISLLIFCISAVSFAQLGKIKPKEFAELKAGTMVVVLNGTEAHNEVLKKTVEAEWKHTPYIFANDDEWKQYVGDIKYFFLMLADTYQKVGSEVRYATLMSIVENKEGATRLAEERGKSFYVFINHKENTFFNSSVEYIYKLPDFIRNISLQWEATAKNEDKWGLVDPYKMIAENHKNLLANKTLLLEKDLCNAELINEPKLAKYYPYKIKFCSKEEVEKAIREKDASKAYAYFAMDDKVGAAISIWEAGTGRCLAFKQFSTGSVRTSSGSYGNTRTSGNLKGVMFDKISTKELKALTK